MAVPLDPGVAVLRAQHPGAYDDLDDATLSAALAAKGRAQAVAARVRAASPGAYDDLDDATLAAAVERKEAVAAQAVPSAPPSLTDVAGAWGEVASPLTGAVGDW